MPYEIRAKGNRSEIIDWLEMNVGEFTSNTFYHAAKGMGWEISPYGVDHTKSLFEEPNQYVIKIWKKDKAFLTRLRWE